MRPVELKHPGQFVCDMHGRNLRAASGLQEQFEIRNVIEFSLCPDFEQGRSATAFLLWLETLCRGHGRLFYTNKYLITIDGPDLGGWWPVAYSYDGRRAGMCQIKARVQR